MNIMNTAQQWHTSYPSQSNAICAPAFDLFPASPSTEAERGSNTGLGILALSHSWAEGTPLAEAVAHLQLLYISEMVHGDCSVLLNRSQSLVLFADGL